MSARMSVSRICRDKVTSALYFKYNTQLGPPYTVLLDTNFINSSIRNKVCPDLMLQSSVSKHCSNRFSTHPTDWFCVIRSACHYLPVAAAKLMLYDIFLVDNYYKHDQHRLTLKHHYTA